MKIKLYKVPLIVNVILGVLSAFSAATGLLSIYGLFIKPTTKDKNIGMILIAVTMIVVCIINIVMYLKRNILKTTQIKFIVVSVITFIVSFVVPYIIYFIWLFLDDNMYI